MGIIRTKNNGYTEYTAAIGFVHLSDIPTLRTNFSRGSFVIGIEDESKWILDDNLVWCKIGSAKTSGISYVVVDELPDPSEAVEGVMYLYKEDGETYYSIYFLSNGSLEKIGGTEPDFGNIVTTDFFDETLENYIPNNGNSTDDDFELAREGDIDIVATGDLNLGGETGVYIESGVNGQPGNYPMDFISHNNISMYANDDINLTAGTYMNLESENYLKIKAKRGKVYYVHDDNLPTDTDEIATVGSIGNKLDDYLPLAGGTMSGNINMQSNTISNTVFTFGPNGMISSPAQTRYGLTGLDIEDGDGGIYMNPTALTYVFTSSDNAQMTLTASTGTFQMTGQNCYHFSINNNSLVYNDASKKVDITFGKTAHVIQLDTNKHIKILDGVTEIKRSADDYITLADGSGIILSCGGKTVQLDSSGALNTAKTTFTRDQEFVTKKYVDDAIAAAIAALTPEIPDAVDG